MSEHGEADDPTGGSDAGVALTTSDVSVRSGADAEQRPTAETGDSKHDLETVEDEDKSDEGMEDEGEDEEEQDEDEDEEEDEEQEEEEEEEEEEETKEVSY